MTCPEIANHFAADLPDIGEYADAGSLAFDNKTVGIGGIMFLLKRNNRKITGLNSFIGYKGPGKMPDQPGTLQGCFTSNVNREAVFICQCGYTLDMISMFM